MEAKAGRPPLSTVVVNKKRGYPTEGHQYYEMLKEVGPADVPDTADDHARWKAVYEQLKDEWQYTR